MRYLKKQIVLLGLALLTALTIGAAPALPGVRQVLQPDGTVLTVEQFGDEYHHWTATLDGMMVVNTGHGYYVASIDAQGRLTASDVLAHDQVLRSQEERLLASRQAQNHARFHQQAERQAPSRRSMAVGGSGYLPHAGSPRVLVILAAFQDLDFTVNSPLQAFDQYLNGEQLVDYGNHNQLNYSSVNKYFESSSGGAFSPLFDVVGPVTLPQTMEYYGKNENMSALCKDAVAAANDQVENWRIYDNDGDGRAELVYIIFAGYGENQGGPANSMWAKTSTQNLQVTDDITVTRFCCCSELFHPDVYDKEGNVVGHYADYINGIGVFCHEFSHGMGLPDIYATRSSGYVNNQTMECWDVMDQGIYNYNGFAPALYLAWEQEVMGWISIEALSTSQASVELMPLEEGGKACKIQNPDDEREYIVMENIQQRGANCKANGHGLLVYHVAYPNATVNMGDSPNNVAGKPAVAVVPADGLLISTFQRVNYKEKYGGTYTTEEYRASFAGDPFPGTANTTVLSDDLSQPNFRFYTGDGTVGLSLRQITERADDGCIVLSLRDETNRCRLPVINVKDGKLSFTCPTEGVEFVYDVTYSNGPEKGTATELTLASDVTCHVSVYATKEGMENSDVVTKDVVLALGAKGDVNQDGVVSISDAVGVVNIILNQGDYSQ